MNPFHRRVGRDDESLTGRNFEHGRVVTDSLRRLPPLGEECADEIEFLAGTKLDVSAIVGFVGHRATAGSVVNTGGSGSNSVSFQARGRA